MALFERSGLEQETGLLSERWGQDGSELLNLEAGTNNSATLHTVTAGKTAYIKQITIGSARAGANGDEAVIDDGGTTRLTIQMDNVADGENRVFNFDVPLYFETDIGFTENGTLGGNITLTGWEE